MADTRIRRSPMLLSGRTPADGATFAAICVVALTIIPSGLILKGLPLSVTPATVIALLMTLLWLCAHCSARLGMAKGFSPMRSALYAYLCALVATYAWATYHYTPADEIKLADHSMVLIVALIGMALLVCDGVTRRDRLDFVLRTVAICCSLVALVAAVQFVLNVDLTRFLILPGLKLSSVNDGYVFARQDLRRVAGTTGNPIEFGVLCAMTMPLVLYFAFQAKRRGAAAWGWWVGCGLLGSGLLFSVSRSAVLGMACAGLILLVSWPARRRAVSLVVVVVFLGLSRFAFPGLLGTLLGLFLNLSTDDSVKYRTHDYPIAEAEIAQHPILGRGVGTFYAPKHIVFDNQYLLTLVEGGIVGLIVMVALFLVAVTALLRLLQRTVDGEDRELAFALMAAVVVPAVGSVTFDLLSFKVVEGVFFVILGAIGALCRMTRPPDRRLAVPPLLGDRAVIAS